MVKCLHLAAEFPLSKDGKHEEKVFREQDPGNMLSDERATAWGCSSWNSFPYIEIESEKETASHISPEFTMNISTEHDTKRKD